MRSLHSLVRHAGVAAAVAGIAVAGLVAAPSASATSFTASCGSGGIVPTPVTLAPGATFTVTASTSACLMSGDSVVLPFGGLSLGSTSTYTVKSSTAPGTYVVKWADMGGANGLELTITVAAANTAPAPVVAAMTLQLGEGGGAAVCSTEPPTAYVGTWMMLPGQADCHKAGDANAKLLGWATSPSFPVAIAQRQADNKWGAYDLTDAEGESVALFIPAGWGTFVTGANNLYPIWSA